MAGVQPASHLGTHSTCRWSVISGMKMGLIYGMSRKEYDRLYYKNVTKGENPNWLKGLKLSKLDKTPNVPPIAVKPLTWSM